MNSPILIALVFACIVGWIRGGQEMEEARNNPNIGIRPSKNLFSFLFLDYE